MRVAPTRDASLCSCNQPLHHVRRRRCTACGGHGPVTFQRFSTISRLPFCAAPQKTPCARRFCDLQAAPAFQFLRPVALRRSRALWGDIPYCQRSNKRPARLLSSRKKVQIRAVGRDEEGPRRPAPLYCARWRHVAERPGRRAWCGPGCPAF